MTTSRYSSKGGKSYPARHGEPPPMSFFDREWPAAGGARFDLALDAVGLALVGIDEERAEALRARYGPYAAAAHAPIAVHFGIDERPHFIEPAGELEFNPIWIACDGTRVRYLGLRVAGWFDTAARDGRLVLASGGVEPDLRAIENYLRCAVAWDAASRGGALVHGASAVRNGRAYLFFGESGAGKSTLSAVTDRATVVSDDLTLLLPRPGGGLDVVGSPFRGTYEEGPPVVGRFPLAAAFRILKGPAAEVKDAPRAIVFGQLVGNLTFVAEAFGARPDLFASVEAAFSKVPLRHLVFRKDDSYWDAIDAAGL
ncbi:MAG TPA: hypothetical protein VFV19_15385 [Candidatus Polarisedimenticolaceae bacterium]|nr:hypothetical protein [Candidatus Polarisedimenticolaceae bacterium]